MVPRVEGIVKRKNDNSKQSLDRFVSHVASLSGQIFPVYKMVSNGPRLSIGLLIQQEKENKKLCSFSVPVQLVLVENGEIVLKCSKERVWERIVSSLKDTW